MIGLHVSKAGHVLPCFPMVFVVLLYPCCRTKHKKNHFASYLSCTELVGYFCFTIWGSAAFSNVCFFLCSSLKTVLFLFFRLPHNSFFFLDFFFFRSRPSEIVNDLVGWLRTFLSSLKYRSVLPLKIPFMERFSSWCSFFSSLFIYCFPPNEWCLFS